MMINKFLSLPQVDNVYKPSSEDFLDKYGRSASPVLISGLMENWKAKKRWTMDLFKTEYGDILVNVEQVNKPFKQQTLRLCEYIDYTIITDDQNPYYLKDWQFHRDCPEILEDYDIPIYFINWFQQLPYKLMPQLRWIYIGSKNTGTKMHQDILMTSAWNAVFCGRKCWLIYPPEQEEYLYFGKVDAFNPDLEKYPLFKNASPLVCFQSPGEILFMPSGWWHQVINEEACISLTENFVNVSNCEFVREYINGSNFSSEFKQQINLFVPQLALSV